MVAGIFRHLGRMWHEPNPVLVKELRGRMRGPRAFVVLTVYLLLLSCLVSVVYLSMTLQGNSYGNYSANLDNVGRAVFVTAALSQAVLITFIAPAFTAGAITGERERKTYETLRSTLLPAHHILLGKLTVALTYLGLLLLAAVPLNGLALMLGGVSLDQVLRVLLILAQSIFSISMLGLFFSSLLRSTLASTVATYATILVLALVLPALVVLVVEAMPYISRWFENVMQFVSYTVASASPVGATLLTTTGEDVWLFSLTSTLTVPAPWLMYLIIHPGGSLVLFALALWRLQSQEIR